MGALDFIKNRDQSRLNTELFNPNQTTVSDPESNGEKRSVEETNEKHDQINTETEHESIESDAGSGTKKMEALTMVWSKKHLYMVYAWIWICFFFLAFHSGVGGNVLYNAYSGFAAPQIPTASMIASIVGGVLKLPIAKLVTIWGRAEGLMVFTTIYLIGMIVTASCTGPDGYAAGYCLYWIGYSGIYIILDVFIADTSGLRNRAFAFAYSTSVFIITAFTGSLCATAYLKGPGWRWAYYSFFIIQPFIFFPLAIAFKIFERKAYKQGILKKTKSGRTKIQSIVYYIKEFDIIGAFILMAAFILFLLPFSLQTNGRVGYKSAAFIVMIVIGILLFPVFYIWERYFATTHFIKWQLFKDKTVLGACICSLLLNFSFECWDVYFYQFVIVVYNLSTTNAGYMLNIYNVGSCFWGLIFGAWVRYVKTWKWTCFGFGLPLMMLGAGLQVHFRGQHSNIGYIIMTQIFIAFGGGTLVLGNEMSVMASGTLDDVPMMLSLVGLFSSIGLSIGSAVIAAIYNNTFVSTLTHKLPDELKSQASTISLGGYLSQMAYLPGTPARQAINETWGHVQRLGSIAAVCVLVGAFPCILVWKNYNVNDKKQNRGTVL
ncbi:unnamed protein product [Ambrosiozyma monospora]|uniref:Unnamed protein product n=1 Tax=Ambrosiozyma monospora TaxID=43982 RepID=A0A9W6Z4B8_AMBMO|nr:unnamed protein product [Ambrosiozyma monospora]